MDATVVVAAMGFASTLLGAWLAAHWQRRGDRDARILDAKVGAYGDCAAALYEYERAMYNRVKARIGSLPEEQREKLRQEAYRCNAMARAAIGKAAILSGRESLREGLESARQKVGDLSQALDQSDLKLRRDKIDQELDAALESARADLTSRAEVGRRQLTR